MIFSTFFILGNRLQTIFDKEDPNITLKQFMLLTMVRQSEEPLTLTQAGKLLGCSRQNIKKLAALLQQKGLISLQQNAEDIRAAAMLPAKQLEEYFSRAADSHKRKLELLFEDYSDEEVKQLFALMTKLYESTERLAETGEKLKR